MTDRVAHTLISRPAAAATALLLLGVGLGGCAGVGDSFASGAFVDPAKYDLYDCKQLEAERKSLATRTLDLQKLIDKAQTGVAGNVVAEVAYRNDFITTRASAKLADDVWRQNKCATGSLEVPAAAAPAAPAATAKGVRTPGRSSSAIY